MELSIRTLAVIIGITHFIQFIVIYYQYKVNKNYKGIGSWLLWSAAEVLAFLIIVIRSNFNTYHYLIVPQNSLIIAGTLFVYVGIMSFFGKKANRKFIIITFSILVSGLIYYTFIDFALMPRTFIINATLSVVSFFTAYNLYKHKVSTVKSSANFLTVILIIHGLIFSFLTIYITFVNNSDYDIYAANLINVLQYTDAFVVGLFWTFGFIVMINQRLNEDNREEKNELEIIFNSNPDSVLITRLSDGYFEKINPGFTRISGYTSEDVQGKTTKDINLWCNLNERDLLAKELKDKGMVENMIADFRCKDGRIITCMVSARIILTAKEPYLLSVTRDISERRHAEIKLQESEDRLARAEKTAKIGNWKLDLRTKEISSSAGARIIYGGATEIITLEDIKKYPLPEYREMLDKALEDLISKDIPYNVEFSIKRKTDGKIINVHSIATYDKANNVIYGIVHDVTEQKKTEERLQSIFANAPVGIFHSNWEGKLLSVNPALSRVLGYSSPEDLIGAITDMSTQIYASQETRKVVMNTLNKTDGWAHWDDVVWKKKDGSIITVDMTGRKVLNENGELKYLEGFIVDITEQKQAEDALKKSEENFKAIANYAASWEAWFSKEGKLLWMNSYSEQLTGYTPEEYMAADKALPMIIAKEDIERISLVFQRAMNGGSGDNVETRVPRKDGSKFWVSISYRPILDANGKSVGFRTSARDITKRKTIEEKFKIQNEELMRMNSEKDKFFSIIAHDLRSPFNGFLGLTELMVTDINKMTLDDINQIAANLNKSSKNLYRLLTNLLEWSKMQRGLITFIPEKISLNEIIDESLKMYSFSAVKKGIEISEDIQNGIFIKADKAMMETIIRNLVSNALKFTNKDGKVIVKCGKSEGNVIITIKDTGIGMDKEMCENLFKLDKQTKRNGTDNEPSTGLGLFLCKEFVEKHKGEILVESEEGKGSEFKIILKAD